MRNIAGKALLISSLLLALPCAALAGENNTSSPADPFASLIRLVASMAIVLGLILAAAFVTKKLFAQTRLGGGQEKLLRVRETLSLGSRRRIFVLEAADTLLVVGATGDNIRLLAELPKTSDEKTEQTSAEHNHASFQDLLGGGADPPAVSAAGPTGAEATP